MNALFIGLVIFAIVCEIAAIIYLYRILIYLYRIWKGDE